MLYELIAVVRPGKLNEVKEIARQTGLLILSSGGVVRGLTNWGTYLLTKPMRKHQARHTEGHHFIMRFDASTSTQEAVRKTLGLDPRMIKFGVVKMGERLKDIKDVEGKVHWNQKERDADEAGMIAGATQAYARKSIPK